MFIPSTLSFSNTGMWYVCSSLFIFRLLVVHNLFQCFPEFLGRHKGLFSPFFCPNLYFVVDPDKAYVTVDVAYLQIPLRYEYASVVVGGYHFHVADELSEYQLVLAAPFVQAASELAQFFVPYAFGVECQAVLKHVFSHNKPLFGSSVNLFPERSGYEYSALGVCLRLNITQKTYHIYLIYNKRR